MKVVVGTRETSGLPDFAGNMWVPLQYLAALGRLGIDAYWVDRQSALHPGGPRGDGRTADRDAHSIGYAAARFDAVAARHGLAGRWCIVYDGGAQHFGLTRAELDDVASESDLLINIAGHLEPDSPLRRIPRRAYVDVDPGFTQMWSAQGQLSLGDHTAFFTVGQNVGRDRARIPTLGVAWQPILPPVALDLWPACIDESKARFSTIADWRGSQQVRYDGEYYAGKRTEFIRFLSVPQKTGIQMEVALCIGPEDHEDIGLLLSRRWCIRDPYLYAGDVESYREFIQHSRAEFSVAKDGYVRTGSGWVSDRTACYLASGKPAVIQSTGFEDHVATGAGLLTFETLEEAIGAVETVNADYLSHARAARRLAEERFDARRIVSGLVERALG